MREAIKFLWMAWRAYKRAKKDGGVQYAAVCWRGVPQVTILCAMGREAWRLSQTAIEVYDRTYV